jgi:hypothetical protein
MWSRNATASIFGAEVSRICNIIRWLFLGPPNALKPVRNWCSQAVTHLSAYHAHCCLSPCTVSQVAEGSLLVEEGRSQQQWGMVYGSRRGMGTTVADGFLVCLVALRYAIWITFTCPLSVGPNDTSRCLSPVALLNQKHATHIALKMEAAYTCETLAALPTSSWYKDVTVNQCESVRWVELPLSLCGLLFGLIAVWSGVHPLLHHCGSCLVVELLVSLTQLYLGQAVSQNPGYLKLRKLRAAQSISRTVSWVILRIAWDMSAVWVATLVTQLT